MLQAMNTGHDGSMSTGHANTPRDMLQPTRDDGAHGRHGPPPARYPRARSARPSTSIVHQNRLKDGTRKIVKTTHGGPGHGGRGHRDAGCLRVRADRAPSRRARSSASSSRPVSARTSSSASRRPASTCRRTSSARRSDEHAASSHRGPRCAGGRDRVCRLHLGAGATVLHGLRPCVEGGVQVLRDHRVRRRRRHRTRRAHLRASGPPRWSWSSASSGFQVSSTLLRGVLQFRLLGEHEYRHPSHQHDEQGEEDPPGAAGTWPGHVTGAPLLFR